jgi:organic radical activating enzyme
VSSIIKHNAPGGELPVANRQLPITRNPNPEYRNPQSATSLPVMESFYSLQGEGFHSGKSAYFIRLGGCDVGCHWCDVKESWDVSAHPVMEINVLTREAEACDPGIVVVTGGEPLMHDLKELTHGLQLKGLRTHIETSGTHVLSGKWDWICFSPKKFKKPLPEIYQQAHELKVVVYHASDLPWAEQHAQKVSAACKLYLQPEWSKQDQMLPLITEYIQQNPKWCISLQTHKYLNLP